jgi:hypothetical protein
MAFVSVPQILTPMRHLRQDEYERKVIGAENSLCQECTEKSAQAKKQARDDMATMMMMTEIETTGRD